MPKDETNKKEKKYPWQQEAGDTDKYNGKIIAREHIFVGQHRMFVTAYQKGEEKIIVVNKSGPMPVGGKYYKQNLNLNKPIHFGRLMNSLNRMAAKIGWPANHGANELDAILSQLHAKDEALEKNKDISGKRMKVNKELRDQIIKYREQISQVLELYWSTNLPVFRKSLNDFKRLVKQKKKEAKYQDFLAKQDNMWILGLEYVSVNRHKQAGTEGIPDFVPRRYDGFHDVIEFKRPSDVVFINKGKRWRQSTPLKDGVSQLMDYLELYDRNPAGSDDITATRDKYRPNGTLIIGNIKGIKDETEMRFALRKHNSFLQRLRVITYDELIEQATTVLGNLEQRLRESRKKKKVDAPATPVSSVVQALPPSA